VKKKRKKRRRKSRLFQRALHRPDNVALSLQHTVIILPTCRSKFIGPAVLVGKSWCKFSRWYSNSSLEASVS